jgi:hypothetical protein
MAQDSTGEILKWGLIIGGAWLAWNYFVGSQAAASSAAAAAAAAPPVGSTGSTTTVSPTGSTTTTTPTTAPVTVPGLQIPSNLSVTPNVNNSLSGNVLLNGESVNLSIITKNQGQTSGVIYNTAGSDITSQFTPAQQQQLVQAFLLAPSGSGTSGLGRVVVLPRMYRAGAGRRMAGRIGAV